MKYTQPKFKIGNTMRVSKTDISFRKRYKPQFTDELFEFLLIFTKCHLHTSPKKRNYGNFFEKELRERMFRSEVSHFFN